MNRPTALLVYGIIAIVWSSLAVLLGLWAWVAFFIPDKAMDPVRHNPVYIAQFLCQAGAGLVFNGMLLAGAIMALMMKPASRGLLRIAAIGKMLLAVVVLVLGIMLAPQMMEVAKAMMPPPGPGGPPAGTMEGFMKVVMYISLVIGLGIGMVMPVYTLIVLGLRTVREAFAGQVPVANAFEAEPSPELESGPPRIY